MKTIELRLNSQRRFDQNQDIHGLEEKWVHHDFHSALDLFHRVIDTCPPPKSPWLWFLILIGCWSIGVIAFLLLDHPLTSTYPLLLGVITITTLIAIWRYRIGQFKFEALLFELCDRLNATENFRGIHYHFSYQVACCYHTVYVSTGPNILKPGTLRIDLDDRYQALTSYRTQDDEDTFRIAIPDVAHVPLATWDEKVAMVTQTKKTLSRSYV